MASAKLIRLLACGSLAIVGRQASAQTTAAPAAAEQGVPGSPDQTAPHQGTAPPAAVEAKKRPPAVDLTVLYTAEFWRNQSGGIHRGYRYLDNLDVTLTVDADRALGWHGATLFVYGLYNNSSAFSGDLVGDNQIVSNIETGVRAARLYQAWIEQRFASGRASLKVGLYDVNSEFDTSNVGSLSLLSSHGIGPEFAQSGRNGPSIFPFTSLGVRGEYKIGVAWTLRGAVLDGVPDDPAHPARTAIKLGHGDGALGVVEIDHVGTAAKVSVGYWRYTARFPRFAAGSATSVADARRGDDGAYVVIERQLTHPPEADADAKRGLAAFAQAGVSDRRFNRVSGYVGAGVVYTGVLGADDRAGITFARAAFGTPYRRSQASRAIHVGPAESVVELTYRRALSGWLTVQPDIQYVIDPSAGRTLHDALAFGLRVETGF